MERARKSALRTRADRDPAPVSATSCSSTRRSSAGIPRRPNWTWRGLATGWGRLNVANKPVFRTGAGLLANWLVSSSRCCSRAVRTTWALVRPLACRCRAIQSMSSWVTYTTVTAELAGGAGLGSEGRLLLGAERRCDGVEVGVTWWRAAGPSALLVGSGCAGRGLAARVPVKLEARPGLVAKSSPTPVSPNLPLMPRPRHLRRLGLRPTLGPAASEGFLGPGRRSQRLAMLRSRARPAPSGSDHGAARTSEVRP